MNPANENSAMSHVAFPMPAYIAAWKTYRTLSNEDDVIAKKVAHSVSITDTRSKILDIGPGDGRVLVRTLIRLNATPDIVSFVEPNLNFCGETSRVIDYPDFAKSIRPINSTLAQCNTALIFSHDIILCTHALYFLSHFELDVLFDAVRNGANLYIVVDHPDSIFSLLWKKTAPTFYERVRNHLDRIEKLKVESDMSVSQSEITAVISDPNTLRHEIKNLVVSMLCYAEIDDLTTEELEYVNDVLITKTHAGEIECTSLFFEICLKR